jgi:hypothetical protein
MYYLPLSSDPHLQSLKHLLLKFSLFNLALVAVLGVVLRSYPFFTFPFNYGFLLHGHSHFAFGGWVMPVLLWMILQYFPSISEKVAFRHWRNISLMLLLSAYGMLLSFPFRGYAPVSIFFSTISVLAGIYLSVVIWTATKNNRYSIPVRFLRAGLFYLCLSSIGPFATGPIVAMGWAGSPIYFNAIYFYLHFQYNGWFSFAILAVLTKLMEEKRPLVWGKIMFDLFNLACIPSFLLSTLWNHPGIVFNVVGGVAAFMAVIAVFLLFINFHKQHESNRLVKHLMSLAITALGLKVILQLLSALPAVADLAFHNRNFIIAYLHLVLLGFITLFSFAFIFKTHAEIAFTKVRGAVVVFLFSFVTTELLLVLQPCLSYLQIQIPNYAAILLSCSIFFPIAVAILFMSIKLKMWSSLQLNS